jgi:hypothetical protein
LACVLRVEKPLTSRGFRLLTLGLGITLLLTLTTLAYSAYENATYLLEGFRVGEGMPQLNVNGTHLTVSNLTLSNRGVYPLSVALRGWVMIGDVDLGSASTGEIMIPPKTQKQINLILPINLTKACTDYNLLKAILFNKTVAAFKVKVDFGFQPFIAASFEGGFSSRVGAALDGLTFRLRSVEPLNETHVKADIETEFTNRSPIPVSGVLHASLPSARQRNLQYTAAPIEVFAQPSQHYLTHLTFTLPKGELESGAWYVLQLRFETFGHVYEWISAFRV